MNFIFLSLIFFIQWLITPISQTVQSDSSKAVKVLSKTYPLDSRRDYKRFRKIYDDPVVFEKLVFGKDSAEIQDLLGEGTLLDRDLFELTFTISDPDLSYALLYKNDFSHFNVKPNDWYLEQFAVIFNGEGRAYKIFDHQTRGYNLFDKRRKKTT